MTMREPGRQIDFLDLGAALDPEATCLVDEGIGWSYREVLARSNRVAHALRRRGVTCAATLSPNDARGFVAILGVFRAEVLSIALNARSATHDNAAHLRMGGAQVLFFHGALAAEARRLQAEVPTLATLVGGDGAGGASPSLDDWCEGEPDTTPPALEADPLRIYRITVTGGTTGSPKGVLHAHRQAVVNTRAFLEVLPYDVEPRYLLVAPMTHAAGLVAFHVLARGGQVHFRRRADPAELLRTLAESRITTTVMPPTLLYDLLAHPDARRHAYPALRYLLVGTAPVSAEKLREAVEVFGPALGQLYGQSECPMAAFLSPAAIAGAVADPALAHRLLSCGAPLPGTALAIMDDTGRLLPDGERGEIVARSGQVMLGYLDQPDATAACSAHGWHHTSDLGYRDADGLYYVVDRKRDLIISGGFNVYPGEVEQVIWSHPAVQDCAVVGVPDARWGEAVKAVVLLKPGASATADELIALCKAQLGSVKSPKTVEFWPELPRSPVGKVLKRVIRDRFWAGASRVI
ncbi:MAG: class I adenylate-forming enzyme family protein [Burkholderiales bacterium]